MKISDRLARRIFIASAAVSLLVVGVLVGAFVPPVRALADRTGERIEDIRRNGLAYIGVKPSGHLEPLRRDILAAVEVEPDRAADGVTLVSGLFGDALAARLYDRDGAVIHEWPVDFFKLFPERSKYKFDGLVHGDHLYPNGDLLMVVDGVGVARIGRCGELIWKTKTGSHHALDIDDEGVIWTPKSSKLYDDGRFAKEPVRVDRIARIDPKTGEQIEAIEIAKILTDAGLEGVVMSNELQLNDILHVNDVEILKRSMASAFPMFEAGDIMVSARNANLILVLDGKTRAVKWWRSGPMHRQHDPDFQPNGEITVFDNRTAGEATPKNLYRGRSKGSRIIAIDPSTYGYRELYASNEHNSFYSEYRGKHQVLDNGNILVTESAAGRVFEATPDGKIAWTILSRYDDRSVGWVMSATRYPASYASIGRDCDDE